MQATIVQEEDGTPTVNKDNLIREGHGMNASSVVNNQFFGASNLDDSAKRFITVQVDEALRGQDFNTAFSITKAILKAKATVQERQDFKEMDALKKVGNKYLGRVLKLPVFDPYLKNVNVSLSEIPNYCAVINDASVLICDSLLSIGMTHVNVNSMYTKMCLKVKHFRENLKTS